MPEEVLHVALEVDAVRAVVVVGPTHAEGVEQVADHLRDYVQAKRVLAEVAQRAAAPLAPARVVDQGVEQAATRTRRCENSTQRERRSQALVGRSPEDPTGNAGGPEAEGQRPHVLPASNTQRSARHAQKEKRTSRLNRTFHAKRSRVAFFGMAHEIGMRVERSRIRPHAAKSRPHPKSRRSLPAGVGCWTRARQAVKPRKMWNVDGSTPKSPLSCGPPSRPGHTSADRSQKPSTSPSSCFCCGGGGGRVGWAGVREEEEGGSCVRRNRRTCTCRRTCSPSAPAR